jgi:hypothetical protein
MTIVAEETPGRPWRFRVETVEFGHGDGRFHYIAHDAAPRQKGQWVDAKFEAMRLFPRWEMEEQASGTTAE